MSWILLRPYWSWPVSEHPSNYKGREIAPMQGKSWAGMLAGKTQSPRTSG